MGQAVAARGSIGGHQGSAVGQQPWLRERLRGRGLGGVARAAHEAQTTEVCTAQLLTHHSVAAGRHLDPRCALRAASRAGGPQRRRWVRGWTSCCASASSASHTSAFKSSMSDSTVRLSGSGHRELAMPAEREGSPDIRIVRKSEFPGCTRGKGEGGESPTENSFRRSGVPAELAMPAERGESGNPNSRGARGERKEGGESPTENSFRRVRGSGLTCRSALCLSFLSTDLGHGR